MAHDERIGILGGTFDPIHLGHVEAAEVARRACALDRVLILPSLAPPHRSERTYASAYHRFAMAALAASGRKGLVTSDLELRSTGPSYTVSTLQRFLDRGFEPVQLFFVTGSDAFAEIATWYGYPRLLDLSHFVVISRHGTALDALPGQLPDLAPRMHRGTRVSPTEAGPSIFLVGASTPDVSSTEIRRRCGAGQSVEGLVPHSVAEYISKHRLYGPEPPREAREEGRAGMSHGPTEA
jgi:nicotinate-nucleotide adenylyltransferase